jgi:hypothetical protein
MEKFYSCTKYDKTLNYTAAVIYFIIDNPQVPMHFIFIVHTVQIQQLVYQLCENNSSEPNGLNKELFPLYDIPLQILTQN